VTTLAEQRFPQEKSEERTKSGGPIRKILQLEKRENEPQKKKVDNTKVRLLSEGWGGGANFGGGRDVPQENP